MLSNRVYSNIFVVSLLLAFNVSVGSADSLITGLRLFYSEKQRLEIDKPILKVAPFEELKKNSEHIKQLPKNLRYLGKIVSNDHQSTRIFWRYKEVHKREKYVTQKRAYILTSADTGAEYLYNKGWIKSQGGLYGKLQIYNKKEGHKATRCGDLFDVDSHANICINSFGRVRK